MTFSKVEKAILESTGGKIIYPPTEKIPCIVVANFPVLGKLTALRFIEWVQHNPGRVISLPTGKTPEYFIKWVIHYLGNWDKLEVKREMETYGINPKVQPEMKSLRFVQIDEFYPMDPQEQESFYYYIHKFYIKGFGLDKSKAVLIDTSRVGIPQELNLKQIFPDNVVDLNLRVRHPQTHFERLQKQAIQKVDQFCTEYENRIRELGGIGFFLGGIGPDGHIGFNVRGSDFHSTTRLTPTNYETQAAAAVDLGGIEVAKKRLVITIGLSTITYNKNVVAIIMAAGEAKAKVVADAIQNEKNNLYPATVLHGLSNARFYVTRGAASLLVERCYQTLVSTKTLTDENIETIVIDLALEKRKRVRDLNEEDFQKNRFAQEIVKKTAQDHKTVTQRVEEKLLTSLEDGLKEPKNEIFLHTAPHHDDIMLGYLPYVLHLIRTPKNTHHFAYMTSGFTAVTNAYMLGLLKKLLSYLETPSFLSMMEEGYFDPANEDGRNRDMYQYLDGIAAQSQTMKDEGESRRLLRDVIALFEEESIPHLKDRVHELVNYFETQYPGKKDLEYIQKLKGMVREWEVDLLWGYVGFNSRAVHHLRLGFYKGEIFTESPEFRRDVAPIVELLEKVKPTVVTVALDPEASGPDTHYKVLQAVSGALRKYENKSKRSDIQVWGYRNVWQRFHPSEGHIFIPVSLNSLAILDNAFMNCFGSQREASFPSYEYDGPFSRLAQKIWVEQYQQIKVCLGRDFFGQNPHPRLRATHGMVYLQKMSLQEFYQRCSELKKYAENL